MIIKRFHFNDSELLAQAFKIRHEVFIEEQKVDEREEFDEFDVSSVHYVAFEGDKPLGTARWRITSEGVKLERFAVLKANRGKYVGRALLERMLEDVSSAHHVYLHAQVMVVDFYKKKGFKEVGDVFVECEIDHFKMTYNSENHLLNLKEAISFVKEFHDAFKLHSTDQPLAKIGDKLVDLRYNLMKEENDEYLEAAKEGDLVEIADALGDMLYILCGTIITHGLQFKIEEVYREIQRSNMSKLDEKGNPIYREDGKVMKSDIYFKPDIARILKM